MTSRASNANARMQRVRRNRSKRGWRREWRGLQTAAAARAHYAAAKHETTSGLRISVQLGELNLSCCCLGLFSTAGPLRHAADACHVLACVPGPSLYFWAWLVCRADTRGAAPGSCSMWCLPNTGGFLPPRGTHAQPTSENSPVTRFGTCGLLARHVSSGSGPKVFAMPNLCIVPPTWGSTYYYGRIAYYSGRIVGRPGTAYRVPVFPRFLSCGQERARHRGPDPQSPPKTCGHASSHAPTPPRHCVSHACGSKVFVIGTHPGRGNGGTTPMSSALYTNMPPRIFPRADTAHRAFRRYLA